MFGLPLKVDLKFPHTTVAAFETNYFGKYYSSCHSKYILPSKHILSSTKMVKQDAIFKLCEDMQTDLM